MSKAAFVAYEDTSSNNAGPSGSPKGYSPLVSPGSSRRPSAAKVNRIPARRNYSGLLGSGVTNEDDTLLKQLDETDHPTDWLNTALSKKANLDETKDQSRRGSASSLLKLDSQLAHLSTVLSISRQDTLSRMDNTMAAVTDSIPKLGLELRLMRDASLVLRQNIADLRQKANAADISRSDLNQNETNGKQDTEANAVLQRLASLSYLLERMTSARDVLSLAESWSTLSTDVTAYLADAKFEVAAARLSKAKSSLSVFERTPEYESHKKLLDGLSTNLENRMTPTLIDAIRDRDIEQAKKFHQVFTIVDRQEQFARIWRRTRAEDCLTEWIRFASFKSEERESVLSQLENRFIESISVLLEEERKIVGQVLPNSPRENVAKLVTSTLTSLEPGFVATISRVVDRQSSTAVKGAVDLHHILRKAVIRIADCIIRTDLISASAEDNGPLTSPVDVKVANLNDLKPNLAISTSPEVRPKPLPSSNARRSSVRRMSGIGIPKGSTSTTEQQNDSNASPNSLTLPEKPSQWEIILSLVPPPEDWEQRLLEPLLDLQLDYELLERNYLGESITKHDFAPTKFNEGNASQILIGSDMVIDLRKMIEDSTRSMTTAIKRTRQLTYGLSCDGLISCLDDNLSSLISHAKDALDKRTAIALEEAQRQAHEKVIKSEKKTDDMYGFTSSSSSTEGIEWKAFEEGMSLLSALHNVLDIIKGLEATAADQMNDLADVFLPLPGSNPADTIKRLCTDEFGTSTAILRLLLDASKDRLRTGSLIGTLKRMRAIHSRSSKNLSFSAAQPVPVLFRQARLSLLEQTKGVQRHLTNMILSPLMPHLELYAGLSIWSANRLPGSVNEYDLAMPTFSLSPTEDMSRIGEALLDLPRLLEVWSELPQFKWSVQGLTFPPASSKDIVTADSLLETPIAIDQDIGDPFESPSTSMSPKREKRLSLHGGSANAGLQSAGSSASNSAVSPGQERRINSGTHRHTPSVTAIATLPARNEQNRRQAGQELNKIGQQQNGEIADAQTALQSYLTSISLTLVSHLISLVLPSIAQLTAAGASQLAADLDYLLTILSALNVTQNVTQNGEVQNATGADLSSMEEITGLLRSLEAWRDICRMKDQDGRRLRHLVRSGQAARGGSLGDPIDNFDGDEDKLRSLLGTHAFDMVARMRGW